MDKAEVLTQRNGTGHLTLKSGSHKQVQWQVDYLRDGSLGEGCIRGDEAHLAAAAKDGCATVSLTPNITAAIAIENQDHGEASFSPLLVSKNVFEAQTISRSSPRAPGSADVNSTRNPLTKAETEVCRSAALIRARR